MKAAAFLRYLSRMRPQLSLAVCGDVNGHPPRACASLINLQPDVVVFWQHPRTYRVLTSLRD
jgi:hypothetical protein